MSYEIEYHDYDVVVVGAGGSGLRATVGAEILVLIFLGGIFSMTCLSLGLIILS